MNEPLRLPFVCLSVFAPPSVTVQVTLLCKLRRRVEENETQKQTAAGLLLVGRGVRLRDYTLPLLSLISKEAAVDATIHVYRARNRLRSGPRR